MASLETLTPELAERRYPSFKFQLTKSWMSDFIELCGYQIELGSEKQKLPPAAITCFRDAEFFVFQELKINLNQLLHTTQKYEYFQDVFVGDWLSSEAGVKRVNLRKTKDGNVVIMEMFNNYSRDGEIVAKSTGTVFVREESKQ